MKIGFSGLLGLAFITLKLLGYIAWPWVWVLSPFWIPLVAIVLVFGFAAVITLTVAAIS